MNAIYYYTWTLYLSYIKNMYMVFCSVQTGLRNRLKVHKYFPGAAIEHNNIFIRKMKEVKKKIWLSNGIFNFLYYWAVNSTLMGNNNMMYTASCLFYVDRFTFFIYQNFTLCNIIMYKIRIGKDT